MRLTFSALGLVMLIALPALADSKKPARVGAKKPNLCAALNNHFTELAWADFLQGDGKAMSPAELKDARFAFPGELASQPAAIELVSRCRSGKLAKSVSDCQLKAQTLKAFNLCNGKK